MLAICRLSQLCLGLLFFGTLAAHEPTADERVDRRTQEALSLDANAQRGQVIFQGHCASCHGRAALGDAQRVIPALAGQRFKYLIRQIANFSGHERDGPVMRHVLSAPLLKSPQAWVDIAFYLNRLRPLQRPQQGSGTYAALGRGIFQEQCVSCHQPGAQGDAEGFVPSLNHQHYAYLASQMEDLGDKLRYNVDEELTRFMHTLDARDRDGLADYISRLPDRATTARRMRDDGAVVN